MSMTALTFENMHFTVQKKYFSHFVGKSIDSSNFCAGIYPWEMENMQKKINFTL